MRLAGAFTSRRKNGQRLGKEQGIPHEHHFMGISAVACTFLPSRERALWNTAWACVWRDTLLVGKASHALLRECYPQADLGKPTLFPLGWNPTLRIMI